MPTALVIEIINALLGVAPQIPGVLALGKSAIGIIASGTVTPDEEVSIRAQLDQVKSLIDAA
jgi:hypothetical protein